MTIEIAKAGSWDARLVFLKGEERWGKAVAVEMRREFSLQ